MSDAINHPEHYQANGIEVIEMIEALGFGEGFCIGNAIKYAGRAGKKDPTKYIEDLEKAVWYLKRRIEIEKAQSEGREVVRPNDMNERRSESRPFQGLTDRESSAAARGAEGFSSAKPASTSVPTALPLEPVLLAREIADLNVHGEWYLITPEGQAETVAFIPDRPEPYLPKDMHLDWLAGRTCVVKIFFDGEQKNESRA